MLNLGKYERTRGFYVEIYEYNSAGSQYIGIRTYEKETTRPEYSIFAPMGRPYATFRVSVINGIKIHDLVVSNLVYAGHYPYDSPEEFGVHNNPSNNAYYGLSAAKLSEITDNVRRTLYGLSTLTGGKSGFAVLMHKQDTQIPPRHNLNKQQILYCRVDTNGSEQMKIL